MYSHALCKGDGMPGSSQQHARKRRHTNNADSVARTCSAPLAPLLPKEARRELVGMFRRMAEQVSRMLRHGAAALLDQVNQAFLANADNPDLACIADKAAAESAYACHA